MRRLLQFIMQTVFCILLGLLCLGAINGQQLEEEEEEEEEEPACRCLYNADMRSVFPILGK